MGSIRVEETSSTAAVWRGPGTPTAPTPPQAPDAPPAPPRSDPELERILKMVESGNLSAQEADDLLRAMGRV
jgi:hypothetical protein